jgi:hypothetical protein
MMHSKLVPVRNACASILLLHHKPGSGSRDINLAFFRDSPLCKTTFSFMTGLDLFSSIRIINYFCGTWPDAFLNFLGVCLYLRLQALHVAFL